MNGIRRTAIFAVAALAMAACGSGDDAATTVPDAGDGGSETSVETDPPADDDGGAAPDTATADTTASEPDTPAEAPAGGRSINIQLYQAPDTFNPLPASTGGNALVQQLHWDAMVGLGGDNAYQGRLATDWSVSDDAQTWTFTLRDDVKWSDGEAFTADDVIFTFTAMANPATGSGNAGRFANIVGQEAFAAGEADSISGLTAPDEHTVQIELTAPNSAYMIDLVDPMIPIVPEHLVSALPIDGLVDNPFFREPPVGIGPYVFSKWVSDDQVEFVANPEYRTELGLDVVYATFLPTDVAQAQLETGEIDFTQVAAADVERVSSIDGATVQSVAGTSVAALHTALDAKEDLANPLVRQAIMHAIDRQAIVDAVLAGEGKLINTLVHGPDWAIPDGLNEYPFDPEKAKALLAEANWDSSMEIGIELTVGQKDRDQVVTIVAGQLQAVGINAVVDPYAAGALAEPIGERDFDLLMSIYGLFNVDPAAMSFRLSCAQGDGGGNLSKYCNPALDELLAAGVATADQAERAEIYGQAQTIVNQEVPIILLYAPNTITATSDRLVGYSPSPLPTQAFWNIAEWSLAG